MKLALMLLAPLALGLAACGGSDSVADKFDDLLTDSNELVETYCSCAPDPAACAAEGSLTPAQQECMGEIVAAHPADFEPAVDCLRGPTTELNDCLIAAGCTDAAALDACDAAYETATANCPEISEELNAMFDACFPQ